MARGKNPAKDFTNATRKGSADGRPAVPSDMLGVFALGDGPLLGICVPLSWKRATYLPPERSLEAWYFLPDSDVDDDEWLVDARGIAADRRSQSFAAQFVYKASLEPDDGKRRLAAAGLITELQKRSEGSVWFLQERRSISIWTDAALQIWHHHLIHELAH